MRHPRSSISSISADRATGQEELTHNETFQESRFASLIISEGRRWIILGELKKIAGMAGQTSHPTGARSRLFSIPWLLVLSLASMVGCDSADYAIVQNERSPSGQLSALLVKRRGHDSLSSDVFYLLLVDANAKLNLSHEIHKEPALVATHAEQLTVEWDGIAKITVRCSRCDLRPIDIIEERPTVRGVQIVFAGLPK
jgi:hypothetical protein